MDVFVSTAAETEFQALLVSGLDGVMRGNESIVGTVVAQSIDDASLDLFMSGDRTTYVFSASTSFLDGLVVGDLVISPQSTELP